MQSRSCCGSIRNDDGRTSYYASVLNRSNVHQSVNNSRLKSQNTVVTRVPLVPLKNGIQENVVSVVVVDADNPNVQLERINYKDI